MNNITILGGAGFIGTNLAIALSKNNENIITIVDEKEEFFYHIEKLNLHNVRCCLCEFGQETDYTKILNNQQVVYHLYSTTMPSNSNINIPLEMAENVDVTARILDDCVKEKVGKIVFISSGGTVYGNNSDCPIKENASTNPINSYGLQKLAIEKLLQLYYNQYNLDYRIARMANPYGPYQRANGQLGVISTFVDRVLKNEPLVVYGDGTAVRDFIYIDDAIQCLLKITEYEGDTKLFNLGTGIGNSINDVISLLKSITGRDVSVEYMTSRRVDVSENYLDISLYRKLISPNETFTSLKEGIEKTIEFSKSRIYDC